MELDLNSIMVEDDSVFNTPEPKKPEEKKVEEKAEEKVEIPEEKTEEEVQNEYEESVLTEIKKHFGYEIEGDFTEDIEGLKLYTSEVAKKIALDEFQQIFEAYPDVADYMKYRMNNGDPAKFFEVNETDYSNIELDETNDAQAKEVVRAFFKKQGFTDEEIKDTIEDYEDTGILAKQAKKVLPKLKAMYEGDKQRLIAEREEQKQKEIEEAKQYWSSVQSTINSGTIKNIAVPEADKKKFFEWLAIPKEGTKSQRDIERDSMSVEDILALEYLMYKKLDISKLSVSRQNTKDTEKLKSLFKSKGSAMKGSGSNYKGSPKDGIGTLHDYLS
jgi:hypothetical protein